VKAIVEEPGGVASSLTVGTQAFWAQPFNKEINEIAIPPNFCEVLLVIPKDLARYGHALVGHLPSRSIRSFSDLATSFSSQFAANKTKHLEVADLFDIWQGKGESSKDFQKGLRARQFSDSLALRKPLSMEEIRTRSKSILKWRKTKPIGSRPKGNLATTRGRHHKAATKEKTSTHPNRKTTLSHSPRARQKGYPKEAKGRRMGANKQKWYEFNKAYGHSTEDCCTL
ncbi:hypothetical protein CR513_34908, partial [Mucuna pruriens]